AVESFVNSFEMLENQENNKSKSDKGYHVVPPPYTWNFIPFKPDLTFMDEIVEIEPKTVRKNSFRPPFIKDWNSDDDSGVEFIPNVEDKTVRPVTEKIKFVNVNTAARPVNTAGSKPTVNHPRPISNAYKKGYLQVTRPFNKYSEYKNSIFNKKVNTVRGNPQQKEYKEKGVINSGCLRHMTGNKCYLTKYEKNNVLFIDTECLVLSSDFKLLDESQVLLRVLRKDNTYSVDLKSVVPTKGLTCLFAKATIDESNLWHRRLGHINFKNMNKLV
ncbi:ribonuclease H-like domain-containing protein, partial [Tanacetum coccineum]